MNKVIEKQVNSFIPQIIANKIARHSAEINESTEKFAAQVSMEGRAKENHAAWQAAQEFEGVFLQQFLSIMFSSIKTDEMFGGGNSEEIFRGFIIQEYANLMAKSNNGIGIAEKVYKEITKSTAPQYATPKIRPTDI